MRTRSAVVLALSLGLAGGASGSLVPTATEACCAAPRPEPPRMVTPEGATLTAGDAVVVYLSERAESMTLTLVAEPGPSGNRPAAPAATALSRRAIAPHVWALEIPASVRQGPHALWAAPLPADAARGAQAYRVGGITVGTGPASVALTAPAGSVRITSISFGRGSGRRAEVALASAPPPGAGVVFEWTDRGGPHGNAHWIEGSEPIPMVSEGRCGIWPYGTDIPAAGTAVRVAFVDARGRLGPWATLSVR